MSKNKMADFFNDFIDSFVPQPEQLTPEPKVEQKQEPAPKVDSKASSRKRKEGDKTAKVCWRYMLHDLIKYFQPKVETKRAKEVEQPTNKQENNVVPKLRRTDSVSNHVQVEQPQQPMETVDEEEDDSDPDKHPFVIKNIVKLNFICDGKCKQ